MTHNRILFWPSTCLGCGSLTRERDQTAIGVHLKGRADLIRASTRVLTKDFEFDFVTKLIIDRHMLRLISCSKNYNISGPHYGLLVLVIVSPDQLQSGLSTPSGFPPQVLGIPTDPSERVHNRVRGLGCASAIPVMILVGMRRCQSGVVYLDLISVHDFNQEVNWTCVVVREGLDGTTLRWGEREIRDLRKIFRRIKLSCTHRAI